MYFKPLLVLFEMYDLRGLFKRPIANISHVMTSKAPIILRILGSNLIIIDCAMGWILPTILVDNPIPAVTGQYWMGRSCHGGLFILRLPERGKGLGVFVPTSWHSHGNMIRSVRAVI